MKARLRSRAHTHEAAERAWSEKTAESTGFPRKSNAHESPGSCTFGRGTNEVPTTAAIRSSREA